MKHPKFLRSAIFLTILSIPFLQSCVTNALTGSSQLNLVSEQELVKMSATQYSEFIRTHTVVASKDNRTAMVQRVGKILQPLSINFTRIKIIRLP